MEKEFITQNDIPIYHYPSDYLHRFCISLYIKAGPMYEKKEENGISHFWEHLIFRNIDATTKGGLKKKIDKMGAYFNATTYKELIVVTIVAATDYFNDCAKIITKIFESYHVKKDAFDIEKKRIKSEIREYDDKNSIDFIANKVVWKGTPIAYPITGTSKSIEHLTLEKLEKFNSKILTSNNVFFYVTGAFSTTNIKSLKKHIEKYDIKVAKKERLNDVPIPKNFFNRTNEVKVKKSDCTEICFSFDIDSTKYSRAELDLLYDILFNGECSKIHQTLSNKTGLIYSYNSALEQFKNIGNLYFSFEVKTKRLLEATERVILSLKKLKSGISDELDYVKPTYSANAELDLDNPECLNWIMAYENHVLDQHYIDVLDRKRIHNDVTPERMNTIINEIFIPSNLVVAVKVEKKKDFANDLSKIIKKL